MDEMERRMEWNGMEWNEEWNRTEWNGIGWKIKWNEMERNGRIKSRMEWGM